MNLLSHVDLKSNDDTADINGFLACEMVHSSDGRGSSTLKRRSRSRGIGGPHLFTHLLGICKPINPGIDTSNNKCRHENSTDDVEMPLSVELVVCPTSGSKNTPPTEPYPKMCSPDLAVESINGQQ